MSNDIKEDQNAEADQQNKTNETSELAANTPVKPSRGKKGLSFRRASTPLAKGNENDSKYLRLCFFMIKILVLAIYFN